MRGGLKEECGPLSTALLGPVLLVLPAVAYTWYVRLLGSVWRGEAEVGTAMVLAYGIYAAFPLILTVWARAGALAAGWNVLTTISLVVLGFAAHAESARSGVLLGGVGTAAGAVALLMALGALFSRLPVEAEVRWARWLAWILVADLLLVVVHSVVWKLDMSGLLCLVAVALCAAATWGGLLLYRGSSQVFWTSYQVAVVGVSFALIAEVLRLWGGPVWHDAAEVVHVLGGRFVAYFFAAVSLASLPAVAAGEEEVGVAEATGEGEEATGAGGG
jgi:hypothetical protein